MELISTSQLHIAQRLPGHHKHDALAHKQNLKKSQPQIRGSGHKKLSKKKLIGGKSQNLVRPSLLKILHFRNSDWPNFLQKRLQNCSSPALAGVKLPLFCQFWQQQHAPQSSQWVRCLGAIIGSPVKSLCPDLRDNTYD